MKIYGYQNDDEKIIELSDITFQSDISELKNLIQFLQNTLDEHTAVEHKTEMCHSHLRDWDKKWSSDQPDIIIVTNHTK